MNGLKTWLRRILPWLKHSLAPVLLASYPAIFHYSNNAAQLLLRNLWLQVLLYAAFGLLIFGIASLLWRGSLLKAANAAAIFLVFFHLYGLVYNILLKRDAFQVEHYTLLPFFLLLAGYAAWLLAKLPLRGAGLVFKAVLLLFGVLSLFNLVRALPVEVSKMQLKADLKGRADSLQGGADSNRPDIYYIIMDEMSAFQPMREFWHNPAVDPFTAHLKANGFLLAEESHGSTTNTLHQLAIRFNYQDYSLDDPDYLQTWFNAIADNRAMRYLESQGYTTVVFDEKKLPYPAAPAFIADVSFNYGELPEARTRISVDDFGMLIANNTMLRPFTATLRPGQYAQHLDMIRFTLDNIGSLDEIPSPKFVHVHLMLPHAPFMFDENGHLTDSKNFSNWGAYLEHYNYSLKVAQKLVDSILAASDPANPPVIILQSDHGARNKTDGYEGVLEDYPPEYKTWIVFAIHLPGLTAAEFPADMDPINTFPLVFNKLFDANLPIR